MFEDSTVTQFDALVLNAQSSDNWSSVNLVTGRVAQFLRDQWAQDMQREMGHVHVPGTYVHLYINGLYWGLYDVMERLDDAFAAEHWGGNEQEYDVIIDEVAFRGNLTAWNGLLSRVRSGDYESTLELLDVDNFIDYLIVNMHMGNWDWPDHNWHAVRRRAEGEKFQFVVWDAEVGMGLDVNVPGPIRPRVLDVDLTGSRADVSSSVLARGPGEIYNRLRANAEFQLRFADRLQKHFFNDGALTPERAVAVYETRANEIAAALVGQSARWGDVRREPPDVPDGTWLEEKDWILNTFFTMRSDIVLDDFRDENLYPNVEAPGFNRHGGAIASGFELTMSHENVEGMILYTLDGSDPRVAGGDISPTALQYSGPISLSDNTTVNARVLSDGEWSALNQAVFSLELQPIRITEINYHPVEPTTAEKQAIPGVEADDFEFIELLNTTIDATINLADYSFSDGVEFSFPQASIGPGEYAVVVEDIAAFRARYGDAIRVLGQWNGGLSNAGENLNLSDALGITIAEFEYGDSEPWPERADGNGGTLELIQPGETPAREFGKHYRWRGSTEFGGSPGTDGTGPIGVVVNEVLAHTDPPPVESDVPQSDAIELFNTTDRAIDMGGWFLSDSARSFFKFEIPVGTVLGPDQYLVFDERWFNPNPSTPGPNDFALSGAQGDDVWLVIPDGSGGVASFVDDVHFPATLNGETLGRVSDGTGRLAPLSRNALGCTNRHPRVGPVVISEINFNPGEPIAAALAVDPNLVEDDLEFIEIHNPTSLTVDFTNWRLRGGVDFDFATGTDLLAHGTLILISFNPTNPANANRLNAFRAHYGIDANVPVLGGFSGQLSDSGERIRLQSPDNPSADDPLLTPRITEDALVYDDLAPWPGDADGTGKSLTRVGPTVFADASTSWNASLPTPGTIDFSRVPAGDFTGDDTVGAADIDVLFDAVNADSLVSFYDIDTDGTVDYDDVRHAVETILATGLGDANLDGSVDGEDFRIWQTHRFTACTGWAAGDFNGDGLTDVSDFNIWNENRFLVAAAVAGHDERAPRAPLAVEVNRVAGVVARGTSGEPPADRAGVSRRVSHLLTPATHSSNNLDNLPPGLGMNNQNRSFTQIRRAARLRESDTSQGRVIDDLFATLDEQWKLL